MHQVISFSVAICMNKTKILCGQLNCSVKLADVSTRSSSHPLQKNLRFIKYASLGDNALTILYYYYYRNRQLESVVGDLKKQLESYKEVARYDGGLCSKIVLIFVLFQAVQGALCSDAEGKGLSSNAPQKSHAGEK